MTISKDRVKPSPLHDSWKLAEIFTTGVVLGGYLAMMRVIFFWAAYETDFFPKTATDDFRKLKSAIYLQLSTISQALIFVTRSRSWSFVERPGSLLVVAFLIAQLRKEQGKDGEPPLKSFKEVMPYTQSLLSKGRAIGYHAKAAPPTITMPHLKAMVSGALGGLLDVAFNFDTQALLDDNIVVQFLNVGWKIVMHWDDTWPKLFPGMFSRHDGGSSFFLGEYCG